MRFYDCITEFIFIEDEPQRSDIIFVPGGSYPDAAERAAELYHAGHAPYIMPSGKYSILKGRFALPEGGESAGARGCDRPGELRAKKDGRRKPEDKRQETEARKQTPEKSMEKMPDPGMRNDRSYETECDYLCDVLRGRGVPGSAILREDQATFTYENAIFSRKRTEELGLQVHRAILCCQAFHARRSLMYYQEQFPDTEFRVCPVVTKGIGRENWYRTKQGIDRVLGEVERCGGQFREILYGKIPSEMGTSGQHT